MADHGWRHGGRSGCRAWYLIFLVLVFCAGIAQAAEVGPAEQLRLLPGDRVLVLAPHPDDETIGCGGILQKALEMKLPVKVVFLTDGDSNQWSFLLYRKHPVLMPKAVEEMGTVRRTEAVAATALLGVPAEDLVFLGYPDLGTLQIWINHWAERPAYQSFLTRAKEVPYSYAFRPGAPYRGEEIVKDLMTILREFGPTKVFVSNPADHHPDHQSGYLFAEVALWNLEREMHPAVYPYLVHDKGWPPKGTKDLVPPAYLEEADWLTFPLEPKMVEKKRAALEAHKSQVKSAGGYLLSFVRGNELFGDFPVVPLRAMVYYSLEGQAPEPPGEEAGQLTDEERALFVGIEWRSIRIEEETLVVTLRFSRPLAKGVAASVYLFGYRRDHPFDRMPKLHLKLGLAYRQVVDQNDPLPNNLFQVKRTAKEVTLRVPLEMMGNPEKIFFSARTYLADIPLDWAAWRILDLTDAAD